MGLGWATMVRRQRSAVCGLCSHLHPVVVAGNAWTEEGRQEEVGGTDHSEVSSGVHEGVQSRACVGVCCQTSYPHLCRAPPPPGSSEASSCAMHPAAPRMPSSWIMCAHLFCSTCGGSYPGTSWTLPGPRPHLPCVRSVDPPC